MFNLDSKGHVFNLDDSKILAFEYNIMKRMIKDAVYYIYFGTLSHFK